MSSDLPLILAGPMVRRVESDRYWIWIATSRSCELQCLSDVYTTAKDGKTDKLRREITSTSSQREEQIGAAVFVSLIAVKFGTPPPEGSYVTYRVTPVVADAATEKALEKRMQRVAIRGTAPRFYLPFRLPDLELEIFHVSCRKLRSSEYDAISAIHKDLIERPRSQALPSLLILGGDQIYADAVEDRTLEEILSLSRRLFQRTPFKGSRKEFVARSRLSSTDCKNHLVDFSELCCLYLMSWSTAFAIGRFSDVFDEVSQWEQVLANVPVYMIFDDHEVSDDWYIDSAWKNNVRTTDTGRKYVDDCLRAYFFFQGWGNDPESFPAQDIRRLAQGAMNAEKHDDGVLDGLSWSFVIPADKLIACLDCRSKRPESNKWSWFELHVGVGRPLIAKALEPVLVSPGELWSVRQKLSKQSIKSRDIALVITNTPVFALMTVKVIQDLWRLLSSVITRKFVDHLKLDPESWDINPASWVELTQHLLSTETAKWVILSGDVHFGYIAEGEFVTPDGLVIPCLQITSSPTNNRVRFTAHLEFAERIFGGEIAQAICLPASGISQGTPPTRLKGDFEYLVSLVRRKAGKQPYVKRWKKMIKSNARTTITTSNQFAKIAIGKTGVAVQLIDNNANVANEHRWP